MGSPEHGYSVNILFKGRRLARHNAGGEFSAVFQNADRSREDRVENWRASSWHGTPTHLSLEGQFTLSHLNTTVLAQVEYEAVTPQVARKRIHLRQADSYVLFYQITNSLEASGPPARVWSFDQLNCKGGALHEYFPAAGFRTDDGIIVGLLTDAGCRNNWTRIIRRDGKPLKPAPWEIPDVRLYSVLPQQPGKNTDPSNIAQTFGEALVRTGHPDGEARISLPPSPQWLKKGSAKLEESGGTIALTLQDSAAGIVIPIPRNEAAVYSIRFRYRSSQAFAVQLWDVDDKVTQIGNLSLYNDRVPESPTQWSEFQTEIFIYSRKGNRTALFISLPDSEQATSTTSAEQIRIEMQNLELLHVPTRLQPYHRLEMDRSELKTSFIFADEDTPDTLRSYRLSSQKFLAEGLGLRGSDTEKVVYADLMMLSWAADAHYARPTVAPSIWYSAAGEMYLRDSFFALNGIHNRELNEGVFNVWAANQGEDGAINTLVEPSVANLERKSNDSTPLWLIWALRNRNRFGSSLPAEKIQKAAQYFLRTYDRRHDATCWAQFVMGQLDVIDYPEGTIEICENQGLFAVTLRVIKELLIPGVSEHIADEYIERAEAGYRSYYDPARKFLRPARNINDAIGFGEIFPEFLSLWLFGRNILSDAMVLNHLDRIPALLPNQNCPHPEAGGTVRPIFIGLKPDGRGWDYFTENWHPMISKSHGANYANHNMDGIYYNGGSWMRIEVCGYVAGKLHGWSKAEQAIANRLWAEINTSPDFPTSQEYLATDPQHPFFGYHRVFAWNSFVLAALELAGMRRPDMDPDFSRNR